MNKNIRKDPIYGNIHVYNMDGKLMFRCNEKRKKWYVSRGLVTEFVNEDLLPSIRLNFVPNGNGDPEEVLKIERKNQCACCGSTDLLNLAGHHIVPREFRVYFPIHLKSRSSLYIVVLCHECHSKYEKEFASNVRKRIHEIYNLKGKMKNYYEYHEQYSALNSLLHKFNAGVAPDKALKHFLSFDKCFEYDKDKITDIEYIFNILNREKSIKAKSSPIFGKIVIEEVMKTKEGIDSFIKLWLDDFFTNMKPNIDRNMFDIAINAMDKLAKQLHQISA